MQKSYHPWRQIAIMVGGMIISYRAGKTVGQALTNAYPQFKK